MLHKVQKPQFEESKFAEILSTNKLITEKEWYYFVMDP